MFSILKKEINGFLNSLVGYVVILVFLVSIGLFVWVFPQSNVLDGGFADLYTFFSLSPYVFLFLIPAITMRTFAEEKKTGTIEILLTRPLSHWQIILGKYLAVCLLVIFTLLPTLLYYATIYELSLPVGNVDSAAVAGSYLGLVLLAGVFASMGMLASSYTQNQIVAFIIGVFLCFIFYEGFSAFARINVWSDYANIFEYLGLDYHYNSLSKGLIDSRNVLYFLTIIILNLFLTRLAIRSRKW